MFGVLFQRQLLYTCMDAFNSFVFVHTLVLLSGNESVISCFRMLRHICGCLQKNVSKRWPDNEIVKPRVVSGFIFLRLLCPALVNPRQFNLVQDTPQESACRTLKLVAKSLINLANLVEVGAKELYMEAIGPFIIDNKPRMVAFLNDLAVSQTNGSPYCQMSATRCLPEIYIYMCIFNSVNNKIC